MQAVGSGRKTKGSAAMPNITGKELSALEDQLNYEQILIKKYRAFACRCTDAQLKTKCEQMASRHQDHFNCLIGHLN
mgnify:CR=1 FL=1